MKLRPPIWSVVPIIAALLLCNADANAQSPRPPPLPAFLLSNNPMGVAATISTQGGIDLDNPFFQSLGSNGRSCGTCHQPQDGWTVTPAKIRARFDASDGTDPIFRTNDGSNSPMADVSTTDARRSAYSMLLDKGLIRVGVGIPANAEFELIAVDDPYGYASAKELSLFRRPLPSTNLKFLSTVMWDGRETFKEAASTDCLHSASPTPTSACFASLHFDLADQANGATMGHAQGTQALSAGQLDAIIGFESGLITAQVFDDEAGSLMEARGRGGPWLLADEPAYFGINDVVSGDYHTGAVFNPVVMTLYDRWASLPVPPTDHDQPYAQLKDAATAIAGRTGAPGDGHLGARRAVARGQALFNSKGFNITGVKGLNDDLGVAVLRGTCTTCHDSPGAGNHSIPAPLDIGLVDASRRTPDLPLYTLRNKATQEIVEVTDPGRALITGKWVDIGRFKGPTLRALASRAPYFHNGSAHDLVDVVDFYNTRFSIGLTADQQDDLVAFLLAL